MSGESSTQNSPSLDWNEFQEYKKFVALKGGNSISTVALGPKPLEADPDFEVKKKLAPVLKKDYLIVTVGAGIAGLAGGASFVWKEAGIAALAIGIALAGWAYRNSEYIGKKYGV